jgi:hypothetical protein
LRRGETTANTRKNGQNDFELSVSRAELWRGESGDGGGKGIIRNDNFSTLKCF